MKKKLVYILLFVFGLTGGVFFSLSRVRASSPVGETSGGESPASVYYDEHWSAVRAIVTRTGAAEEWAEFDNFNQDTPNSKKPKMVVTKWRVHGHIHFP